MKSAGRSTARGAFSAKMGSRNRGQAFGV
jgi:hypothetical protein